MAGPAIVEILSEPTVDVVTAGRLLGVGRDAARKAALNGDIPTIRVAGRSRVPTAKLRLMLGLQDMPPSDSRAA